MPDLLDLFLAITACDKSIVQACLSDPSVDLNGTCPAMDYKQTPLMYAIGRSSLNDDQCALREEIAVMVLNAPRTQVEFKNDHSLTALHAAANCESGRVMDALLKKAETQGVDIRNFISSPGGKNHASPVYIAARRGNIEALKALLKAGASVNDSAYNGRELAWLGAMNERVKLRHDVEIKSEFVEKRLNKLLKTIECLLQNGFEMNRAIPTRVKDRLPLVTAVMRKDLEVLIEMLRMGADPLPAVQFCEEVLHDLRELKNDEGDNDDTAEIPIFEQMLNILTTPITLRASSEKDIDEERGNSSPSYGP